VEKNDEKGEGGRRSLGELQNLFIHTYLYLYLSFIPFPSKLICLPHASAHLSFHASISPSSTPHTLTTY